MAHASLYLFENLIKAYHHNTQVLKEAGMLLPMKSVTAFIGLSSVKEDTQKSCKDCFIQGVCAYRRRGEKYGS